MILEKDLDNRENSAKNKIIACLSLKAIFTMRTKPQRIKFLLAIGIAFFIVAYPAYLQFNRFIEIDFLSPHPSFENLDQENLLADEQSKTRLFILKSSPEVFLLGIFLEEQLLRLSFQIFPFNHPVSILRC